MARTVEARAAFEGLEGRVLLFAWTANEVYMLELVNRARSDPAAEGARLGLDLTADLHPDELARLVPQEPLALVPELTTISRNHSLDMAQRSFFDHENPDGDRAQQRADKEGYEGSAGENIAVGWNTIDDAHKAWLDSVGPRKNVLSLWSTFTETFHYDEFGAGFFFPGAGGGFEFRTYYTQVFGASGFSARTWLLGVVYHDANGNSFYNVGEGYGGVRIDVSPKGDPNTVVGTYTTDAAGNYQIQLPGGEYRVTFTDTSTGKIKTSDVTIVAGTNVKLDAKRSELTDDAPPPGNVVADGAIVNGSASPGGLMTVTTMNAEGVPIAFQEQGLGTWEVVDIRATAGGPVPTGPIETWTDPKDGRTYAAAASGEGLLLYMRNPAGQWSVRNLTTELANAGSIVGSLTVFISTDDRVAIAGLDADGDLLHFAQTGAGSAGAYAWAFQNIAEDHLRANGQEMPVIVSELISYVTSWNGMNVAGLDASGAIQSIWWAPGMASWRVDNLSEITGAPSLSGGLTAYLTSWGGINLAGTNAGGKVLVTWWVPEFGGDWLTNNLSDQFGGPPLAAGSMTSYVTSWGGLNVAGIDTGGALVIYWWSPGLTDWVISPLSDEIADAPLPVGAIRGVTADATGSINVLGATADGEAVRYTWVPGGAWEVQNLTALT